MSVAINSPLLIVQGGGGGGAFILRPGATEEGNVYASMASLLAATTDVDSFDILLDDSIASPIVLDATYDLSKCQNLVGIKAFSGGDNLVRVEFQDGAQFTTPPVRMANFKAINRATLTVPITLANRGIVLDDNFQYGIGGGGLDGDGTVPLIDISSGLVFVTLRGRAYLGQTSGSAPCVRGTGGVILVDGFSTEVAANGIEVNSPAFGFLTLYGEDAVVQDGALTGTAPLTKSVSSRHRLAVDAALNTAAARTVNGSTVARQDTTSAACAITLGPPLLGELVIVVHEAGSNPVTVDGTDVLALGEAVAYRGTGSAWVKVSVDHTALHKATAGEINALPLKATPVGTDVLVVEDSAAGFAKVRVPISALPSGGGGGGGSAVAGAALITALSASTPSLPATDGVFIFPDADIDGEGISYDNVTGTLTFDEGFVGDVEAEIRAIGPSGDVLEVQFYDVTNGQYIGSSSFAQEQNRNVSTTGIDRAVAPIDATAGALEVQLRLNDASGGTYNADLSRINAFGVKTRPAVTDLGSVSGAVAIDAGLSDTFAMELTGAATIGAPTNLSDGQRVVLRIAQDGTGSRAVTFNAVWDFGDETAPDTSADAAGSLLLVEAYSNGTKLFATSRKGYTS